LVKSDCGDSVAIQPEQNFELMSKCFSQ